MLLYLDLFLLSLLSILCFHLVFIQLVGDLVLTKSSLKSTSRNLVDEVTLIFQCLLRFGELLACNLLLVFLLVL